MSNILIEGDSWADRWTRAPLITPVNWVNNGLGGSVFRPLNGNSPASVTDRLSNANLSSYDQVIIFAGLNDIMDDVTLGVLQSTVAQVKGLISAANSELVVASIPPFKSANAWTQAREDVRLAYNNWLVNSSGCVAVDLDAIYDTDGDGYLEIDLQADTLHITTDAYLLFEQFLFRNDILKCEIDMYSPSQPWVGPYPVAVVDTDTGVEWEAYGPNQLKKKAITITQAEDCCLYTIEITEPLVSGQTPANPVFAPAGKSDGDTLLICHPNGLSMYTCVNGAWALQWAKLFAELALTDYAGAAIPLNPDGSLCVTPGMRKCVIVEALCNAHTFAYEAAKKTDIMLTRDSVSCVGGLLYLCNQQIGVRNRFYSWGSGTATFDITAANQPGDVVMSGSFVVPTTCATQAILSGQMQMQIPSLDAAGNATEINGGRVQIQPSWRWNGGPWVNQSNGAHAFNTDNNARSHDSSWAVEGQLNLPACTDNLFEFQFVLQTTTLSGGEILQYHTSNFFAHVQEFCHRPGSLA